MMYEHTQVTIDRINGRDAEQRAGQASTLVGYEIVPEGKYSYAVVFEYGDGTKKVSHSPTV